MKLSLSEGNEGAKLWIDNEKTVNGVYYADIHMKLAEKAVPKKFVARSYDFSCVDCFSTWKPNYDDMRSLGASWAPKRTYSSLASWMPVHTVLSLGGRNRLTVALSDAFTPTGIKTGVLEENAQLVIEIVFFTRATVAIEEYHATVRIDTRDIPYYDSIYDTVEWWEKECGYTPMHVPEHAKLPMNSLWYSYHQRLDVGEIIRQCRLSKELGMETVIVDDGWQTDDNSRGYAYCGDWEVAESKIPDMKQFVDRVHETDMKIMLWYSVPFVGIHSKAFEHFKTMLLCDDPSTVQFAPLDPRYKEVRDYLIGIYTHAVREWGLDGLKLDFIDSFYLNKKAFAPDDRRDYDSLEEAVDRLMTDVSRALSEINPEILIEFRQTYVGPAIRKYGNMLRVSDCPNDALRNKAGIIDLRLTSGKTAVHSDMLMWHYNDTVETAAMQIVNVLYGVPQISVRIDRLNDKHYKMLKYYLSFWRENAKTLMDGKLLAAGPESGYTIACAELDKKAIFTCYSDTVVEGGEYSELIAVNGSRSKSLYIRDCGGKSYRVVNCMGETLCEGKIDGNLAEIAVPTAGVVFIK